MRLSIIYVNFNTTQLLLDSLASLQHLPPELSYEVIVVDNDTSNFKVADITDAFPEARVIESGKNLGFGRGNNLGAQRAKGEYLWILNTDTVVPPDNKLAELLVFLDTSPDYAGALPLLMDDHGVVQPTQVAYFPEPHRLVAGIPVRLASRVLPRLTGFYSRVNLDYAPVADRDIPVAAAAALVVRTAVFRQVGGFSPEFFMFFEDSDLCRKFAAAGYKLRWFTSSKIVHLWGRSISGSKAFNRRKALYFQSQDVYLKKWHGRIGIGAVKLLRLPLRLRYQLLGR